MPFPDVSTFSAVPVLPPTVYPLIAAVEKTEKIEKKAKKQNLETEFYSDGIIEGDDGSLVKKSKED